MSGIDWNNALQEARMVSMGKNRYRVRATKAEEKQRMSHTGSGVSVTASAVPGVAKGLQESLDLRRHRKGPIPAHILELRKVNPRASALIAVRTVLDQLAMKKKLTAMAMQVGARIEDELRLKQFKKQDPEGYKRAQRQVQQSQNYRYQHRVLVVLMKECELVANWVGWKPSLRLGVGMHLIELMMQRTDLLVRREWQGHIFVSASEQLLDSLVKQDERLEVLHPWFLPTLEKPKMWNDAEHGGYFSYQLPLVKRYSGSTTSHMPSVASPPTQTILAAVNALQETPWRVNRDVLTVLETLWDEPYAPLPQVPSRQSPPAPERPANLPFDIKKADMDPVQRELFTAWKRAKAQNMASEVRRKSQLLTAAQTKIAARELVDRGVFYFPHQLDWRGRAYAVPIFLSPQGPDLARGLLEFAEGKALGSEDARTWFLVTGANHFGVDKVDFDGRIDWVDLNMDRIASVGRDPLADRWWMEAAEPYQFLAWCLEVAKWQESDFGLDFVSHKVCGMDGSCNGLQHFSAMLRDPRGGKAVNLTPSDKPQDIYQEVCDVVKGKLEVLAEDVDPQHARLARMWLKSDLLDRKAVKRQVMTLPYGATRHGMQDMLMDHLGQVRDARGGYDLPFDDVWAAAMFLTGLIHSSITEVVVAASAVMSWLQEVAKMAAAKGLPLRWRTPHGFFVNQSYRSSRKSQVNTHLCGRVQLIIREYRNAIDKKKQVSSVSPNFVHALDSCHMMMTVEAAGAGLSWAMVHDSFGSHAADCGRLAHVLRATFVTLYETHDVLAELRRDLELNLGMLLPEPPAAGMLDIRQVLESPFFFA